MVPTCTAGIKSKDMEFLFMKKNRITWREQSILKSATMLLTSKPANQPQWGLSKDVLLAQGATKMPGITIGDIFFKPSTLMAGSFIAPYTTRIQSIS